MKTEIAESSAGAAPIPGVNQIDELEVPKYTPMQANFTSSHL